MKALVLDFDGVIADSQMECLFVGFNAYLQSHKITKLFDGRAFTFDNFNFLTAKHRSSVEEYKRLRPYVIDAFCFYAMLHIIDNHIAVRSQSHYNEIREKLAAAIYNDFVKRFYEERQNLIKNSLNEWLALSPPYKRIIQAIKNLGAFYFAISTNNRAFTINAFSKKNGISPRMIVDSSFSTDKAKHLEHIKNNLKSDFSSLHFVDDQINHFPKLLDLGAKCYLATWGYNTEEQQKEARRLGVVLLAEDEFYKKFAEQ